MMTLEEGDRGYENVKTWPVTAVFDSAFSQFEDDPKKVAGIVRIASITELFVGFVQPLARHDWSNASTETLVALIGQPVRWYWFTAGDLEHHDSIRKIFSEALQRDLGWNELMRTSSYCGFESSDGKPLHRCDAVVSRAKILIEQGGVSDEERFEIVDAVEGAWRDLSNDERRYWLASLSYSAESGRWNRIDAGEAVLERGSPETTFETAAESLPIFEDPADRADIVETTAEVYRFWKREPDEDVMKVLHEHAEMLLRLDASHAPVIEQTARALADYPSITEEIRSALVFLTGSDVDAIRRQASATIEKHSGSD